MIENCDEIKKLHPSSLNTFRIITYVLDSKVFVAPVSMRIGQGNNKVDNAHQGGIFINVNIDDNDGFLDEFAFTEFMNKYDKHPTTGILFKNYKIPFAKRMVDAARKMHEEKFSNLGLLSFDMTLDNNYFPVVIEINIIGQTCWFPQMASGKGLFGDNTDKILQMIRKNRC